MNPKDREILRALANRQLEHAGSEKNRQRIALWYRHNDLEGGTRPLVNIELDTFAQELVDPLLQCEDEAARGLERELWLNFYNLETFDDDWVVPDYFPVRWESYFHPFGFDVQVEHAGGEDAVGHRFVHPIGDLEEDYEKLGPSVYGVDRAATEAKMALAEDAFGDILPVRATTQCLYAVPTQQVVHLMGMENMMFALYDCPELFHQMMGRLADDYIAWFRQMEQDGFLVPTVEFQWLGQGSRCFTNTLKKDAPVKTTDLWGFMDSQETVSISPEMYAEFIFPYYERIARVYGRLSYGCCEPVDPVWDKVSRLPNLRKVSISPWCNEEKMGEALRGGSVIYHRKPSPNFLGVAGALDEDAVRAHIAATAKAAGGCTLEVAQRDVYTVGSDAQKVARYVQLIREELEKGWRP